MHVHLYHMVAKGGDAHGPPDADIMATTIITWHADNTRERILTSIYLHVYTRAGIILMRTKWFLVYSICTQVDTYETVHCPPGQLLYSL